MNDWLTEMFFKRSSLKTTGALDDCSLVGHLNTILARGGGNLNDPIFKSSNVQGLPGRRMLKFRVDRRISVASFNMQMGALMFIWRILMDI